MVWYVGHLSGRALNTDAVLTTLQNEVHQFGHEGIAETTRLDFLLYLSSSRIDHIRIDERCIGPLRLFPRTDLQTETFAIANTFVCTVIVELITPHIERVGSEGIETGDGTPLGIATETVVVEIVGLKGSVGTTTTHEGYSQSPIHFLQRRVTILGIAGIVVLYQFQYFVGIALHEL